MDILLGNLSIPKADENLNEISEDRHKILKNIELNWIAYTVLILSNDVKASNNWIPFSIVK
jgi:hypothetical protein